MLYKLIHCYLLCKPAEATLHCVHFTKINAVICKRKSIKCTNCHRMERLINLPMKHASSHREVISCYSFKYSNKTFCMHINI